ncbi:MAG TPA: SLC13 family permease [Candidatus Baltobacteraceae bacterium]|jgi:arsenical pump membrane protein|nr:SLC13 family permease [Candidatus Baltobacteraceae bacterium]
MSAVATWVISAAIVGGILLRPWRSAEWQWAVAGAAALVVTGLLPLHAAALAVYDGLDVYLFLFGMLLLAELARAAGLFDAIAADAARRAAPSRSRLFFWTYAAGVCVTAFLSNDGTIVLLTPAVLAAGRAAQMNPLPYAFACVLVANAASFVLPISNPANLVVFRTLPALAPWIRAFALPSAAAIVATALVLYFCFSRTLRRPYPPPRSLRAPHPGAQTAAVAIGVAVLGMLAVSAVGAALGVSAFFAALACAGAVGFKHRDVVREALRSGPWSIVPLVAGLFVMVAALDRSGAIAHARALVLSAAAAAPLAGSLLAGSAAAIACNVINNLPAAVIARYSLTGAAMTPHIARAVLIGIDLGPNFTPAGSLASILWLMMLRRERIDVRAAQFIAIGAAVTVPALLLALVAVIA